MGNTQFAREIADFADLLAEYDHLPELQMATVLRERHVHVGSATTPLRTMISWAAAFSESIRIKPNVMQVGQLTATVQVDVAGWTLEFGELLPQEAVESGRVVPGLVAPGRLGAALDASSVEVAS